MSKKFRIYYAWENETGIDPVQHFTKDTYEEVYEWGPKSVMDGRSLSQYSNKYFHWYIEEIEG